MRFWFVCVAAVFGSGVCAQDPETETPVPPAVTSFTCHGRPPGYYADVETGCRTYHVCDGISHFTYICPRRTLFQQKNRICDHAYRVRCEDSPRFYEDEAIFLRVTDSEESTAPGKVFFEHDYDQTDEFIPTETTPFEDEKPTEEPTTSTETTVTPKVSTESTTAGLKEDSPVQKFLKFRLKDFRSMFFIPELGNNSIVGQPEKELILPVEKGDLMVFKSRREGRRAPSSCPAYCNQQFFLPGTCHPCIMIK